MLLIKSADEAAALDGKQRNRLRVLGLSPAYDDFLDAAVAAYNAVAVPKEEAACAKGGHDFDVRRRLADKIGVVVFKILARSNPFRQTRRIGAERESGDEISARAQAFHSVLHELIEALNDR